MKYILDCINEKGLSLELKPEAGCVCIKILDDYGYKMIYFGEDEIYELLGVLHHIQKQMIQNKK